jgi:hypothetical protein
MANETFMDKDAVRNIASGFETASEVLNAVAAALEAAMMTLKVTAYVGLVGGAALERYIANIKPKVEKLAKTCEEMSNDLRQAVSLREQAEAAGDSV